MHVSDCPRIGRWELPLRMVLCMGEWAFLIMQKSRGPLKINIVLSKRLAVSIQPADVVKKPHSRGLVRKAMTFENFSR